MTDLIDVMPFEYQITESANGRFCVEGVFQRSDVPNANKRVYPRRIWEKELNEKRVCQAIEERSMFGELDHPSDGKTSLKRVAHLITGLQLQEDGVVTGKAEILPTPNGEILKTLFESGAKVGISSRGSGSVNNGVVQEDFKLGTFDFVARPSTPGATPVPKTGGFSGRGRRWEDVEGEKAIVQPVDDDEDALFKELCQELDLIDLDSLTEDTDTMDFNELAEDVILVHNLVTESGNLPAEVKHEVDVELQELTEALLHLAAQNPQHGTIIEELLEKVNESWEALIVPLPAKISKEEPMDKLQFITDRLTEADEEAYDEVLFEAEEMAEDLDGLSDDELIDVALQVGVLDPEDFEDEVYEDEDDDEIADLEVQDLFDYAVEQEQQLAEAAELIANLAGALEESEDVDDVVLKYEAALNIIQETVGRYQLLQEAVGGEDKANQLMENHIERLEASEANYGYADGITEDADFDIERLLHEDGGNDAKMDRNVELAEAAIQRLNLQ